ncbi:MAG: hypothetical protein GXY44_03140 [Phycisphaerales bacterium]|nr:hypothetical protein [Phycisphaerales bacterium]
MSTLPESFSPSETPVATARKPSLDLGWVFIVLAAGLLVGSILGSFHIAYSVNDASRWNTVYSLVTHGRYAYVDDPVFWRAVPRDQVSRPRDFPPLPTIDMVKIGDEYYSSKPPLMPTFISGCVMGITALTGRTFADNPRLIVKSTLIILQVIPLVGMLLLVRWHFRRWITSPFVYHFCMATAALGTYLTSWSVTLNNHVMAACAAMVAVHALWRIWLDGRREWYWFGLAGFFSALTASFELPAAFLAVCLFAVLGVTDLKRALLVALPAALIVVAAALYTNYLAFGTVVPVYATFGQPGGPYDYEGSYWNSPEGLDSVKEPRHVYLMHMLIGHHGIFLLTPVLLLSFWGMLIQLFFGSQLSQDLSEDSRSPLVSEDSTVKFRGSPRLFAIMALLTTVVIITFYATNKTQNYGGSCQGLRWMFWLIPLWLLFLPTGVARIAAGSAGRFVCYAFLFFSVVNTMAAIPQPWAYSWVQRVFHELGWTSY